MKNYKFIFITFLFITTLTFGQNNKAKELLDKVSTKMSSYSNMNINFSTSLTNEDAGIKEGDEPPILGTVILSGDKYSLDYLGSNFMFDGNKLYVINHDEQEITINDGDLEDDDGFIYPSKLLSFYKNGYNFKLGKTQKTNGKQIQYVTLTPIDSNSEIIKVEVGIDISKLHIFTLIQTGANSSKTKLTITSLKSNLELPKSTFVFDKESYLKKDYIID